MDCYAYYTDGAATMKNKKHFWPFYLKFLPDYPSMPFPEKPLLL